MKQKPKFWRIVVLFGVPYGVLTALFNSSGGLINRTINGLVSGSIFGLLLGLIWLPLMRLTLSKFGKSQRIMDQTEIEPFDDETMVFEGPANHFKRREGRGGRLYLTDKRLHFVPHFFNIQRSKVSIPVPEVVEAFHSKKKTIIGVIANELIVKTKVETHRFVVDEDANWPKRIVDQMGLVQSGQSDNIGS